MVSMRADEGRGARAEPRDVSVIVPVFNEADNLGELYVQLVAALEGERRFELVFVDDGSTDKGFDLLAGLHGADARVKVVRLVRNFGQQVALLAGLEHARGRVLVSFDADLQFDPRDIPRLVAKVEEGYDVVSGCRIRRGEGLVARRLPSALVNWTMARLTGQRLRDAASPFKAVRAEMVDALQSAGEMRRFLGALALRTGRAIAEVPVAHRPRRAGRSKYSFLDLVAGYLDLITAFWPRAFQVVGLAGLGCLALSVAGALAYVVVRVAFGMPVALRAQAQAVILLLGAFGLQCVILGLLGEFTTRIYRLVQDRPLYAVKDVLG
jgi:glycosyltransferase involved in cell wall biosynthesis